MMDKRAKITLLTALFIVAVVAGLAVAKPSIKAAKECNDGKDNDGDGKIDLADAGCVNRGDNDETNCGDGVCEGGEVCDVCIADCGYCNSCSDSDYGFVPAVQGTVSGYSGGSPYSYTDYCLGSMNLTEYSCSGGNPRFDYVDCAWYNATCINGACVNSTG